MKNMDNNRIKLIGQVIDEPTFSHEINGEGFFEFVIEVSRLSANADYIPVIVSERGFNIENIRKGEYFEVEGSYRSHNKIVEGRSKLLLHVFAERIEEPQVVYPHNEVTLEGNICKPPVYRKTPHGREITDLLVAVNRSYGKSDYIPCIAWGRNARFASNFKVGDLISCTGRVQSRVYKKNEEEHVAYEVSLKSLNSIVKE